jgi:clan AA aspartic protease (TIGR02281 family)
LAYHCYSAKGEAETRALLNRELDEYASFEAERQGRLPPPAPPPPLADPAPPAQSAGDSLTLYPDHDARALYAYIDIGPWPQRVLLDTGATSLTVTEPLAERLLAQGFAQEGPKATATLADGSAREGRTIIIDSVTIGSHVLRDVRAGVTPDGADMLLGLPMLNQIGRFTIDSVNHKLIFS